jgi:hypothetical protein
VTATKRPPETRHAEEAGALRAIKDASRDVVRGAIIDLASRGLSLALLASLVAIGALVASGDSVPAWIAVAIAVASAIIVLAALRKARRAQAHAAQLDTRIAELEPFERERPDLDQELATCEWALRRHEAYGDHICEIMSHLQKVIARALPGVSLQDFIDRGILQPARDSMQGRVRGDVRLSILVSEGDQFRMLWSAGHNLESQSKYRLPIADSLAGQVLASGIPKVWADVEDDPAFKRHPKATRSFRSMVSLPIRIGDGVGAVFNVISSAPQAFDPAELNYITSLGAVIDLVVGLVLKDTAQG